MKAELLVQVSVNGRPLWIKKKMIGGELTKPLTDREYDQVVDAAATELEELVLVDLTATKPAIPAKSSRAVSTKR